MELFRPLFSARSNLLRIFNRGWRATKGVAGCGATGSWAGNVFFSGAHPEIRASTSETKPANAGQFGDALACASWEAKDGVDWILELGTCWVRSGYIRPQKPGTFGYIRDQSCSPGCVRGHSRATVLHFAWGTFGATSLSLYNTKRGQALWPQETPSLVASRILQAHDRSHPRQHSPH